MVYAEGPLLFHLEIRPPLKGLPLIADPHRQEKKRTKQARPQVYLL